MLLTTLTSPAVMFSIGRSRYTLFVQLLFLALNAIGVFVSTIYNANTPDLYLNNAHHKLGWLLTWITSSQILIGIISTYAGRYGTKRPGWRNGFVPVSTEAMAEHQRLQDEPHRFSNDSGQGTEPNTESLRSHSISSIGSDDQLPSARNHEENEYEEKHGLLHGTKLDHFLSSKIPRLLSSRILQVFQFFYNAVDRLILILSFAALATGVCTYGGLFVSHRKIISIQMTKLTRTKDG
jgi:hypothetical protein